MLGSKIKPTQSETLALHSELASLYHQAFPSPSYIALLEVVARPKRLRFLLARPQNSNSNSD